MDFLSFWDIVWFCISLPIGYCILLLFGSFFSRSRLSSNGKAVLITGCDSGFGYMLAKRMALLDYTVLAGCLSVEDEGARDLKVFSPNIKVFHLDVTDDQSVKDAGDLVCKELTGKELWAVVNNAGIAHASEMEWTSLQTILDVFNVNTFGMVRVTQRLLPILKKSKGRIINVTSISAEVPMIGAIGYTMSKTAAKKFNDVIRVELRKWGIKVINIAPYFYGSKMTSLEKVSSIIRKEWNRSEQDTRKSLGDTYIEDLIKVTSQFLKTMTNPHLDEVVDCMEDAITSPSPKLNYRPGSILNKVFLGLIYYYPISLQDYLQDLFLPSIKR